MVKMRKEAGSEGTMRKIESTNICLLKKVKIKYCAPNDY